MSDKNNYLTIEEAIALVTGLDRELVSEVSLEDMLDAFIESAKTDYKMAKRDILDYIEVFYNRQRVIATSAALALTHLNLRLF